MEHSHPLTPGSPVPSRRALTSLLFVVVAGASVGLLRWVDRPLYLWLARAHPGFELVPDLRLTSLFVCMVLFAITGPEGSYRLPRSLPLRPLLIVFLSWLGPAAFFVLVRKVWVPALPHTVDVVAFMVTGLLAEELLFRGAVYQLAHRALRLFGPRTLARIPVAILISALLFGVSHLQYHSFQLSPQALTQVAYTAVMGVFLAWPRWLTGSIWPGVLLHVLNNALTLLR